jgi:hypothetical protein
MSELVDREALYREALGLPVKPQWGEGPYGCTIICLNDGTLDLGIVRDSVANAANDYVIFDPATKRYFVSP